MMFRNRIDDRGRFFGLKVSPNEPAGQTDSHGSSAALLLDQMREIGKTVFTTSEGETKPDFRYNLQEVYKK